MNSLLIDHAYILNSAGRYKEASQLYSSLMEKRDSLEENYMRNQLNEMSVNYQLENEWANRNQANMNLAISLSALLINIDRCALLYLHTKAETTRKNNVQNCATL